ncbi:unnamed protein product [Caenorhabditis nigoni]
MLPQHHLRTIIIATHSHIPTLSFSNALLCVSQFSTLSLLCQSVFIACYCCCTAFKNRKTLFLLSENVKKDENRI